MTRSRTCPACGRQIMLLVSGVLRDHKSVRAGTVWGSHSTGSKRLCLGSGENPDEWERWMLPHE